MMTSTEQSLVDELKTVKEQVEYLLERFPITRNSDDYLTLYYLKYICHWPISWVEASVVSVSRTFWTVWSVRWF